MRIIASEVLGARPIRQWRVLATPLIPPLPPPLYYHHYHHRRYLLDLPLAPPSPPPLLNLPPPPASSTHSPASSLAQARSIPVLLPLIFLFFLVICFLSIFLFRDILHFTYAFFYGEGHPQLPASTSAAAAAARRGLDPTILASFPTLPYALVRELQEGKCGAECAVCLSEFTGGDVIRLLTVCCHAFHPPCIDSWLATHATCPLCRSDLEAPPDEAAIMAVREAVDGEGDCGGVSPSVSIVVDGEAADGCPEKTGECVEERREERANGEVTS